MKCPNCGTDVRKGKKFCTRCGNPLPQIVNPDAKTVNDFNRQGREDAVIVCKGCGAPLQPGKKFCTQCGLPVGGKTETEKPQPKPNPRPPKGDDGEKHFPTVLIIVLIIIAAVVVAGAAFWFLGGKDIIMEKFGIEESDPKDMDKDQGEDDETTATPTPKATETATPTVTPTPTATPTPTVTPTPTATPVPTATPTPIPTATPTPAPVAETISIIGGVQAPKDNFVMAESGIRYIAYEELNYLEAYSADDQHCITQVIINEMFARYGYRSISESNTKSHAIIIKNDYYTKDWFKQAEAVCPAPNLDWESFMYTYLNDYERHNIDVVNQWQMDHGIYY